MKHPNDCTEEEYKEFYRKVFLDFKEPLFWIHLNMDYPFNLTGILIQQNVLQRFHFPDYEDSQNAVMQEHPQFIYRGYKPYES